MANNTSEEIISQLNKVRCAAVFCHARPDGDALGAGLALCRALRQKGATAVMCCEDRPPEKFSYNGDMAEVKTSLPREFEFDTFISVDCADISRMGVFTEPFQRFKNTVNIDHHISNKGYAKYNYVFDCSASCQILTELLVKGGYEITPEIANLLMLGLITDSGNFTHLDVSEKTFSAAALLRSKGADVSLINYEMYSRQSKARALLYGQVISGIRFSPDDKIAFIVTSLDDLHRTGTDKSVTEGFVDFGLTIDGVEVSVALLEVKKNQYKASLRSKGKANVNAVAAQFGGGGHVLASGCMFFYPLEEVIDKLTYAIGQNL